MATIESNPCSLCPRRCGAYRDSGQKGACGAGGRFLIARAALHRWEEPCISGENGSGTVFFAGCPLKCVYCQNAAISHTGKGREISAGGLTKIFDDLIQQGARNLNLVTPTHFAPLLAEVLRQYRPVVPVVYNTSGYERVETLKLLEGLVDVYLPDIKYYDSAVSQKYSNAADYFEFASKAVLEMQRQTGTLKLDSGGMAAGGLLVRHLVLPGNVGQTVKILRWLRVNLPPGTAVSLMSQYTPYGEAKSMPPLNRKITGKEYDKAVAVMLELGFENGYIQEIDSSGEEYIPSFNIAPDETRNGRDCI